MKMDKDILKQKLEETKAKLKANSKDAHFADTLIDELLSIKGMLSHEPTLVHIPLKDIVDTFDGAHFEMCTTKDGSSIYRTKGGYTIIADYRLVALNAAIKNFIEISRSSNNVSSDEMEAVLLELDANAHVLNIPMIAFSDAEFKFELAKMVVKYLRDTYYNAINTPLKEETIEENRLFEESVKAVDAIENMV